MADPTLLDWLAFGLKVQQSQQGGQFKLPPMSPEQQQMFQWAMGILQGTPSSSAMALPILGYDLAHPGTIDMNALKAGKVGYTPAQHMSPSDLAAVLKQATGGLPNTNTQSTPSGDGTGSGPTGVPGDPFGHITSPAGSPTDPFANQNNAPAGNTNAFTDSSNLPWDTIKQLAAQYGKSAGEIALGFITGNVGALGKGIVDAYQSWKSGQSDPGYDPYGLKSKNPNVPYIKIPDNAWAQKDPNDPSNWYKPRENVQGPTYQQQAGNNFLYNQSNNLMNAPGQERSDLDLGFGYGKDYTSMYGDGSGEVVGGPGGALPWTKHPLV